MADDPFDLERFLQAQASTIAQARAELAAGEKRTHWMWFIFPQIAGLGTSPMAQRYAISGLAEAVAYLQHPVLGPRLQECTQLALGGRGRSVDAIFGYPDDLKFHSSITLFLKAAESTQLSSEVFSSALQIFFSGVEDPETLRRLS